MANTTGIFKNGSTWLRADFHLHTSTATEFKPKEESNQFPQLFINKLLEQNIRIAAITNHNKFDLGEFKAYANLPIKTKFMFYQLSNFQLMKEQKVFISSSISMIVG